MDKLWISLLFLLQFSSLCLSSYTPPKQYFINCGSTGNFTDRIGRTFVGDEKPTSSFSRSGKGSRPLHNTIPPSPGMPMSQLYETARTFKSDSSYKLNIPQNGTHLVRFHFFAPQLNNLTFDVSASGSNLLSNFTILNSNNSPVVKEFFLSIDALELHIDFKPHKHSLAFVNGIEVFLCPDDFIPDTAPLVSQAGLKGNFPDLPSWVLETVHRVNVGGPIVTADNDTLGRNWVRDDPFLYTKGSAKNIPRSDQPLNYGTVTSKYIAPDSVYQSAKQTKDESRSDNITWRFDVSKNAKLLVRAHFCDMISQPYIFPNFTLFLYGNYQENVDVNALSGGALSFPFYLDHVVDSGDSALVSVSISPSAQPDNHVAFLNGLEIMQVMAPRVSPNKRTHPHIVYVVVGSAVAGLFLICGLVGTVLLVLNRRKAKPVETGSVWRTHKEGSSHVSNLNLHLRISFAQLESATKKFNDKLIIGKGGFGNVYSGKLSDGTKVAVKRSQVGSGQGLPEFHTEINVLSKIRHRHLVSLIGYCDEGPEMILVYEFMEKGTLNDHLYGDSNFPCLSWEQRLEICIGAAKGLHYLHKDSGLGIIHRDVKSTNILLDENHIAKVSDFGISRLVSSDETHVDTGVKGTFGYLDPDYFGSNLLTEKSDVYSFGVVLLEVLCARPALDGSLPRDQINLAEWGLGCKKNGLFEQIVDPLIKGEISPNSLRKFGEVVEKCLQECGSDRPTMGDVLWDLDFALRLQQSGSSHIEPLEDSGIDCSSAYVMPIRRFPSTSLSFHGDDRTFTTMEDGPSTNTSQVFSQLNLGDGR